MRPVIAIANHKGGTGKTTTTFTLHRQFMTYAWLHQIEAPVAIDLDPQGNLTRMLNVHIDHTNGIADVLLRRTAFDVAMNANERLVGTDIKLEDAAAAMQTRTPNHLFLANAIRASERKGIVLIDCPPAANILTINALVAATHVIVVLDPEHDAIDGMRRITFMVDWLRDELGQAPAVLGAIVTKVNANTLLHQRNLEAIGKEATILGQIPYRRGRDAEQLIAEAYRPVALGILDLIGGHDA
jgi:chromosome partitioning protein